MDAARSNVAKYLRKRRELANVPFEFIIGDALEYEFPPGPLVVFLYNPFGEQIMVRLLDRLERAIRENPRDTVILYRNAMHASVFDGYPLFSRVHVESNFYAFRTRSSVTSPASEQTSLAS
jgi:hypothetical protein